MSDNLITILNGNTFVVSDDRGDIEASPTDPTGLFSFDTRFISKWVLTVNAERLTALSTDDLQYFETRFFLVPGTGTVYVDAKLSVIRQRSVANGFHEDLTILNHAETPVDLVVRMEVGSDFADLFEVKDALDKKGSYSTHVDAGRLLLTYRRGTFSRSTAISSSQPCVSDENGVTFELTIAAHGTWTTALDVWVAVLEADRGREGHAAGLAGAATRHRRRAGSGPLARRIAALGVRLGASADHLPAQPDRSRGAPLLASDLRPTEPPRRGPAVVHDDVRSGQHLHQPPNAAVQPRARGDDVTGAWAATRKPHRRFP